MSTASRPLLDDLHFGAPVFAADGVRVGDVHRLIVDKETLDPHSIVVKETRRFSGHHFADAALIEDDVAVALSDVHSAHRDRVDLAVDSAAVRHASPYLSYRYAPLTGRDAAGFVLAQVGQIAFAPPFIEEAHKRLDELEITPGENVMLGSTGRKLGTVRDVVFDASELVGVVMHPAGFFKQDVLLQVRFLGRSDDMALFAHLTEDDLQHLQPFHPERR